MQPTAQAARMSMDRRSDLDATAPVSPGAATRTTANRHYVSV